MGNFDDFAAAMGHPRPPVPDAIGPDPSADQGGFAAGLGLGGPPPGIPGMTAPYEMPPNAPLSARLANNIGMSAEPPPPAPGPRPAVAQAVNGEIPEVAAAQTAAARAGAPGKPP